MTGSYYIETTARRRRERYGVGDARPTASRNPTASVESRQQEQPRFGPLGGTADADFYRYAVWGIRSYESARFGRHGRGVSRARYQSKARGRAQSSAGGAREQRRSSRAVSARSGSVGLAQSSEH